MPQAIPLIALAVTAAGTGAGIYANQAEGSAMNQATQNSVDQLQALQRKATPTYEQTLAASKPASAQKDVTQGQQVALGDYIKANAVPLTTSNTPLPSGRSSSITDARTGADISRGQQAGAQNFGYTNLGQQWSLQDQAARDVLGNIVSQGSSIESSLPAQLALAKNSEATLSGIGSLATTAGGLAGTAYNAGAFNSSPGQPAGGGSYISDPSQLPAGPYNPFPMYNWDMGGTLTPLSAQDPNPQHPYP